MEKLIELLNEYEISKDHRDYEWKIEKHTKERMCWTYIMWMSWEQYTWAYIDTEEMERIIISKKYEFINWLVENNHIHNIKLLEFIETEPCVVPMFFEEDTQKAKALILMLSIQEDPVDALLTVIK